jgi:hypothetical protein
MGPILATAHNDQHTLNENEAHDNDDYDSAEEQIGEEMLDDTGSGELNAAHHLYGYLPDDTYNPESMEEDGTYPEDFIWTYQDLPPKGINEDRYNYSGPGPCLKPHVSKKFRTVLQACRVAGGFTYELIKHITANSNAYASRNLKGSNFEGNL